MKQKSVLIVASLVGIVGAIWFYRKRSAEIAAAHSNPNASIDSTLGALAANYDRATGQTGDTYTSNDRYSAYKDYLKTGGATSGKSFTEYLTASQGQSLPMNS